ncbi:RHS repeat-associated core domain-containing protein [Pseudomonas fulva]|nr:RHS repeat-associated core domain-containing protein [Pseudomonas fulva]MBF8780696.1 RHS repeat-associated core domain-containing protein [Pseudomonas fulva]
MANTESNEIYFYEGVQLITVHQSQSKHSIMRGLEALLAELDDTGHAKLLVINSSNSVIQTNHQHRRIPKNYTAYGYVHEQHEETSLISFNGERRMPILGYYMLGNGARAFNPVLMRFQSSDNLSPFQEGGINSYSYCLGDPINFSDPSGHVATSLLASRFRLSRSRPADAFTHPHRRFLSVLSGHTGAPPAYAELDLSKRLSPPLYDAALPPYTQLPGPNERRLIVPEYSAGSTWEKPKEDPPKYFANPPRSAAQQSRVRSERLIQDELNENMTELRAQLRRNLRVRNRLQAREMPVPASITRTISDIQAVLRGG